jgi:hypothetical protein
MNSLSGVRLPIFHCVKNDEPTPRASVGVEVQNGIVTFTGPITDEWLRGALKAIAENMPGCVATHDHMAWIEPNSDAVIPSEGEDPTA